MSKQNLKNMQYQLVFKELIWPYRPDILIRLDFLVWLEEYNYLSDIDCYKDLNSISDIINCENFFTEAKKHPYFLQFTRKHRYRKLNLPIKESEIVYAQGVLSFIKLLVNIKINGFDPSSKITIRKSFFLKSPKYGKKNVKNYYMVDGCHRLACLVFLRKSIEIPGNYFKIKRNIVYQPVNSFGIFKRIGIFDSNDESEFDKICEKSPFDCLNNSLEWIKTVRLKFQSQEIEKMFDIKFID
jgi:hypothetical protein